jgi:TRAP-type mannitol/chloroaromatic compound transport system permease large subunit
MIDVEIMPPLMFGGLVLFLLIGFPAAFSLAAVGLFFGFASIELGFFTPAWLGNLPLRVFGIISNDLLLAIPFFTFMGAILERCGLRRTCWRARSASSSARSRAGWPMR